MNRQNSKYRSSKEEKRDNKLGEGKHAVIEGLGSWERKNENGGKK